MRKCLFVTLRNITGYSGGMQCSERNLNSVSDILGKDNVYLYPISRRHHRIKVIALFYKVWDIVNGHIFGVSSTHLREITHIIKHENITDVFLDGSIFGIIAKRIKEVNNKIRITVFFHNVEYHQVKNNISINGFSILSIPILHNIKKNEKLSCRFSDKLIALNNRDAELIRSTYGKTVENTIPISFKDINLLHKNFSENISVINKPYNALFIGSYFLPNIEGLVWFSKKVLPFVNITLTIIGNGMQNIISELALELIKSGKITVLGSIDNLAGYYEKADLIIMPLLSGGGMKVKTAEALMYGKLIIGTPEAFCGYDDNSGIVCRNEKEFITTLNDLEIKNKFHQASRDLFLKKYSYPITLMQFKKIFQ